MSNQTAIAKVAPQSLAALAQEYNQTEGYIQTIKDTIAVGATTNELRLFLETAKRTGLDPMARQIFCVKRWAGGKEVISVQTSIDGFRLIADRTGNYVPSKEPTYTFKSDGSLESATAYVKKYVAGTWHEICATAFYDEYVQTKKDGKPNSMWQKMPRLMLAKCAESLALRKAFPAQLSGLYTSEEMNTPTEDIPTATIQENNPPQLSLVEAPNSIDKPEEQPKSLFQQIGELCQKLNAEGDSIEWKPSTLTEYINMYFDDVEGFETVKSVKDLDETDSQTILSDLTLRYEEILARKEESSEVIDGIAEVPAVDDDEVF